MKLFFGAKKQEAKPATVDVQSAIKQNMEAIDMLRKRQVHIEKKIQKEDEEARARAKSKDKQGALMALRRKQMLSKQYEQLCNQITTLDGHIMMLENSSTQQIAVNAMAQAVGAIKNVNQQMNVDKIDKLMDDMQEQRDVQQEIDEAFRMHANPDGDEELLQELAGLEAEELEKTLITAGPVPSALPAQATAVSSTLPAAPSSSVAAPTAPVAAKAKVKSDEEQLAELQAELA